MKKNIGCSHNKFSTVCDKYTFVKSNVACHKLQISLQEDSLISFKRMKNLHDELSLKNCSVSINERTLIF